MVGRQTLRDMEVKIGDNQELLVRGPSVMVDYWRKPEETWRVIGPEGWLMETDTLKPIDKVSLGEISEFTGP